MDRLIEDLDERNWVLELNSKTTLQIYRQGKLQIRQEKHYNSFESCLLFRARSNSAVGMEEKV